MDFIEGLPASGAFSVIFVVVDRLSKYGHFFGLKHLYSALDVALKFITEVVKLHGFPSSIVSDRDKVFLSSFWKECFRQSGTKLKYSTVFHPQTDGQTEVLNRSVESYLRCFASAHPKTWYKFLSWAEFWYNAGYHSAIHTTPFKVVYGRDPPPLLHYEEGSTSNFDLESMLVERDRMLGQLKMFLEKAQGVMKRASDKHRRELEFVVGDKVFLKIRPYRQHSVTRRICQKLAANFYGPFEVLERAGKVAYWLQLPVGSKIHPVFHVSQLKPVVGTAEQVTALPTTFSDQGEFVLVPAQLLETRYTPDGYLELLVQWESLPAHEVSWVLGWEFARQFPLFPLEDKFRLVGRGIDTFQRVYFRKKNHEKKKWEGNGEKVDVGEKEEIQNSEIRGEGEGL